MLKIKPVTSAGNTNPGRMHLEQDDIEEFQYRLTQIETAFRLKRRSSYQKNSFLKNSKSDSSTDVRLLDVGLSFIPELDRNTLLKTGQTLRQLEARLVPGS